MNPKEIQRRFREARFANSAQVEAFIQEVGPLPEDDLETLFGVLADRRLAGDERVHKFRCALFKRLLQNTAQVLAENFDMRGLFSPMIRVARTGDTHLRDLVLDVLPLVNNVGSHRELVQLFRANDPGARAFGQAATAKVGGKTAFGLLCELCAEPGFSGRIEAMDACIAMAGYHAIPALRASIEVGILDEKLHALSLLGDPEIISKNREGALEAIAVGLGDAQQDVAIAAVRGFSTMAGEEEYFRFVAPRLDAPSLETVCAVIEGLAKFRSSRVLATLREQLLLGPKKIRLVVLETLERIGHEDVLPVVAEALNHRQIEVRLRAAKVLEALANAGKVEVARTIVWLLRSKDRDVKRIAADIARRVPDPDGRLWPQLFRFLRDEDWWVRERITDALTELAGNQLTRHVVSLLDDESAVIRRYAIEMLMRVEDPESLGALVRTVQNDDDWWVRERAVQAVGILGDQRAVPYIVDFLNNEPELDLVCIHTLGELGDRRAAPHVAQFLDPDDVDLSMAALQCLDALGDVDQLESVMPFTEHYDHKLRVRAREIARRWDLQAQFSEWEGDESSKMSTLDRLLWATARAGGDDLLLGAGRRPYIKRMGDVTPLVKNTFSDEQVRALIYPHLSDAQIEALEDRLEDVDFSYEVKSAGLRFRANVLQEYSGLAAVFRVVRNVIPAFEELGLPPIIGDFGDLRNGLVLVGGPTGSGKSTTLAALIDYINRTYKHHIITLEDPIEVVHTTKNSLINQRELGTHSADFRNALRSTLREDPDVILIGEMRDVATISFAISAAETGHLVFGTVHTTSADTSVDRIINAFPAGQQPQVRTILASSLRAVVCQYLVPRLDGNGRVPAVEVMLNNDAVQNLIRKGKTYQIPNVIATSREIGMVSMDSDLTRLYRAGIISGEEGYMRAVNKKDYEAVIADHEGHSRIVEKTGTQDAVAVGEEGEA